jgi:hypothetical protein
LGLHVCHNGRLTGHVGRERDLLEQEVQLGIQLVLLVNV